MEIIGVDRPDCTHVFSETLEFAQLKVLNADTILGLEVTCKPLVLNLKHRILSLIVLLSQRKFKRLIFPIKY